MKPNVVDFFFKLKVSFNSNGFNQLIITFELIMMHNKE